MLLGEKIRSARQSRGITQSQLAGDRLTRNMISRIETGTANPSLDTIKYLAKNLSLPVSYLLSEDNDLLFYEKKEKISVIYSAYTAKDYSYCIEKIDSLSGIDDELAYILAVSLFERGKKNVIRGALRSAVEDFDRAEKTAQLTVLSTVHITSVMKMYRSIASNIQAPLLEFDDAEYMDGLYGTFDYDMYRYLIQDYDYEFRDDGIRLHAIAKKLIRERRYSDAVSKLLEASEISASKGYNSFVVFGIYADLEQCYKQLFDFENAYRYATKRMSMLEGFKT
jgi:transcriptional regulator with XRE-family HTH domain